MKLSEVKNILKDLDQVSFRLENGKSLPAHFNVTEVGMITKHFIDCGGVIRTEKKVGFQLWSSIDVDHRLAPTKLLNIIRLSEEKLGIENEEIEVEYQGETIGKYHLDYDGKDFVLISTTTACLALDSCGIPNEKPRVRLSSLVNTQTACDPKSGCC